jgi:hypothetical protein
MKDNKAFSPKLITELAITKPPINGQQSTPDQRAAAWMTWVAGMREWGAKNLPTGHKIDDSRESIYD